MAGRKWTEEEKQAARDRLIKMRAEGKLKRKPKEVKVKDIHVPSPTVKEPEFVEITINLAPSAEVITINSQQYWHGRTYKVEPALARDINAVVGNTWKHEAQIHGESENQYRRPTHRRLRPS